MRGDDGQIFAFGDFVFNAKSGDLTKNGTRIRLNKQTAELLTILVTNAGTLVTRSQIRKILWPEPQMLNYEKVISNGIGKLRHTFRDDSRNPRYIECIPKRGYRLLPEVRRIGASAPPVAPWVSHYQATPAEAPTNSAATEPDVAAGEAPSSAMETAPSPVTPESRPLDPPTPTDRHIQRYRTSIGWLSASLLALIVALVGYAAIRHGFYRREPPLPAPTSFLSMGIAPFETHSSEAEELGSSFRLDLTDALSQLPQVRMRAANSMENLKPDSADLSQEAMKLHLDTILFGRLTLKGRDFHLQLELVRSSDAAHIATLQFHGTKDELVTVRDKIQQEIFAKLRLPAAEQPNGGGDTNNPRAYEAYLNGRYHYLLQTNDSLRQAAADFNNAIVYDPHFARAYAALGRTYLVMGTHSIIPRQEGLRKASVAIDKAQTLNPTLSDVHAVRGLILLFKDWDATGAERELRQAIQIDPNQAMYHAWLARVLVQSGHFEQAHREIAIAHDDDPYNIPVFITEAYLDQNAREYPQMLDTALKTEQLMHGSPLAMDIVANALWAGGRNEEAIVKWHAMAVAEKDKNRAEMEDRGLKAFRVGGVKAYALVRLQAIQSRKDYPLHANDFTPVEWYAAAGKDKEALGSLRQSLSAHDPEFLDLILIPSLDGLRRYPDYRKIVSDSHIN
jgi:DNA-binding winged helix-turn-helix (wHTH) protein/TolB-like protein/Tfp pilus assembly protein PilF